jgi:hypothetical protein
MSHQQHGSFASPLTRVDAFYFTVTTFATVGFGDIVPVSQAARVIVTVQMIGDLIVLGAVLKLVVGAVKIGRERGSRQNGTAAEATSGQDVDVDVAASPTPPAEV